MIFIVNTENRLLFTRELTAMHRHRKAVFIDRLKWNITASAEEEVDAYDREDTIYLLAKSQASGELMASARLLPTTGSHLLSDHFLHACVGPIPRGLTTWEASRFCPAPTITSTRTRVQLLWEIIGGIMETALLYGVTRVTFTANAALFPLAMECGWRAMALGPTLPDGNDEITAVCASITTEGLKRVKARLGAAGPLTRLVTKDLSVAA